MACACIDIGSNTTRLLVADSRDGVLRELLAQRAFTRIGKSMKKGKSIPAEKVAETADVVASQARMAREMGAARIEAVATTLVIRASCGAGLAAGSARGADSAGSAGATGASEVNGDVMNSNAGPRSV